MEDKTTTDLVDITGTGAELHEGITVDSEGNALTEEQVQSLAQPETATESAEVAPVDNSTERAQVETTSNVDPDLLNWAKKKGGFDTDDLSPGAVRALEIAYKQDQEFHRRSVEQSELRRQMEQAQAYQNQQYQQPYQQAVAPQAPQYDEYGQPPVQQAPTAPQVDTSLELLKFQVNHRDYEQGSDLDMEMGKVVAQDPLFWATRLDKAYQIAKANLSSSDVEARIEAARRDERDRLTRKSSLSQAPAQATTAPTAVSGFSTPAQAEAFIGSATKDEYNARIDDLQKALGIELRPRR